MTGKGCDSIKELLAFPLETRRLILRRFHSADSEDCFALAVLTGLGFRQAGTVSIDCDLAQGQRMLRCLRDETAPIR